MAKKRNIASTERKKASAAKTAKSISDGSAATSSFHSQRVGPDSRRVASSKRPPLLSNHQIGIAAGEVWKVLAEEGEQSLAALKKSVDSPSDQVLAAVGWLAREGKLDFKARGRSVKVSLR